MLLGSQKGSRNQGKAEAIRLGVFCGGGDPQKNLPKVRFLGVKPFLFFCIMIQAQELRRYDPLTSASSIDSGSRAASLRPFDFCFFHCDLLSLLFLFVALRRVRRYDSLEPLTQCRIKEKCVKLWVVSRRHRMDIGGIVRHACGRSFPSFMLRSRRSVASRTRRTGR